MKKKSKKQIISVVVTEWFEKRDDGVYMVWEFVDGKRMERLIPYDDLPVIEVNWYKDIEKYLT